jgi:hypothetical protein
MANINKINAVKQELDSLWERIVFLQDELGISAQLNVRLFNKGGNCSDMDFNYVSDNVDLDSLTSFANMSHSNFANYAETLNASNSPSIVSLVKINNLVCDKLEGIHNDSIYVVDEIKIINKVKMYKLRGIDKIFSSKHFISVNNQFKEKLS